MASGGRWFGSSRPDLARLAVTSCYCEPFRVLVTPQKALAEFGLMSGSSHPLSLSAHGRRSAKGLWEVGARGFEPPTSRSRTGEHWLTSPWRPRTTGTAPRGLHHGLHQREPTRTGRPRGRP